MVAGFIVGSIGIAGNGLDSTAVLGWLLLYLAVIAVVAVAIKELKYRKSGMEGGEGGEGGGFISLIR